MAGKRQDDAEQVEMQCDMLFILSALCEGDMHRKVSLLSIICTSNNKY